MIKTADNISNHRSIFLSQDCDKRLAEVEASVGDVRRTHALSGRREILPADVLMTVNKVYTDADRYFV